MRTTGTPLTKSKRRRGAAVLIVLLGYTLSGASSLSGQSVTPKLTVDFRPFGYTTPQVERYVRALNFLHDAVAFLDEDTLAVSYFVKNDYPELSKRDGAPTGHVLFRSAFVDTRTGSVSAQRSWGNAGYWNAFLPVENGGFFVQANDWISVYSRTLQLVAKRRLIYPSDLLPRFEVSPSGHTLYGFQDWQPPGSRSWVTRIALLDPATLHLQQAETTPVHSDETVSDRQVVYQVNPKQLLLKSYSVASDSTVKIPAPGSELGKLLANSHCSSMAFVSNSVLAIGGGCSDLILLSTGSLFSDGLMANLKFKGRKIGGDFHSSRDGNRLAFILYRTDDRLKQQVLEVEVYDITERKVIFQSDISPSPHLKIAAALSPSGTELALLTDEIVRVWQLPSEVSEKHQ